MSFPGMRAHFPRSARRLAASTLTLAFSQALGTSPIVRPNVEPFLLHLYTALAEKERAVISQRTKAALVAAKARGQALGNPRLSPPRGPRHRQRRP